VLAPFGFTVPLRVAEVEETEVADPVVAVGGIWALAVSRTRLSTVIPPLLIVSEFTLVVDDWLVYEVFHPPDRVNSFDVLRETFSL